VWNISTGKLVRSMADITSERFGYGINSVSFSHDGHLLAGIANEGLYIWDVSTGKRTRFFPVPQSKYESDWPAPNRGCAFSPTENIVAVPTGNGEIYFVDAEADVAGKWQIAIAEGHDGSVKSVAWQRDGSHLVSGGSDSTVILRRVSRLDPK
jgi:WD40 repeat protein